MSHRRAKKVRKQMFQAGLSIGGSPYAQEFTGQVVASKGRRLYQLNKRKARDEEK